jgi:hypothetical protein
VIRLATLLISTREECCDLATKMFEDSVGHSRHRIRLSRQIEELVIDLLAPVFDGFENGHRQDVTDPFAVW